MKQYHIYHATSPGLRFTEQKDQPREYVGFVEANSIEEAYQKSQNFELLWNPSNPCRSTSVGDVIQEDEGFFLVKGIGFELLDETSPNDHALNSFEANQGLELS
jgi:hypothetical protein